MRNQRHRRRGEARGNSGHLTQGRRAKEVAGPLRIVPRPQRLLQWGSSFLSAISFSPVPPLISVSRASLAYIGLITPEPVCGTEVGISDPRIIHPRGTVPSPSSYLWLCGVGKGPLWLDGGQAQFTDASAWKEVQAKTGCRTAAPLGLALKDRGEGTCRGP